MEMESSSLAEQDSFPMLKSDGQIHGNIDSSGRRAGNEPNESSNTAERSSGSTLNFEQMKMETNEPDIVNEQCIHTAVKMDPEELDQIDLEQEIYRCEGHLRSLASMTVQTEYTSDFPEVKIETDTNLSEYDAVRKRLLGLRVNKSYNEGLNVRAHNGIDLDEKPYVCKDKGKPLQSSKVTERQKEIHTVIKSIICRPHSCIDCGKSFRQLRTLKQHQFIHSGEKPLCCIDCGKHFNHLRSLMRHQQIHTGEKPHSCSDCGKSFRQLGGLKRHQLIHTGERQHSCTQCGKSFSRLESLKTHNRMHTGEKPYSCTDCSKSFSHLGSLKSHQRIHSRQQQFSCMECNKTANDLKDSEQRHIIHTDKFWSCTACGNSLLPNLKPHQLFNTKRKPYSCTECGKCFTNLGSLKLHLRIHTGEKPHSCTDCGKSFRQLGTLKRHQLIHNGEKPHCCTICGKTFSHVGGLKVHQQNHHLGRVNLHALIYTGDKTHSCSECGKGFQKNLKSIKEPCHIHAGEDLCCSSLHTHQTMNKGGKACICTQDGQSFSCSGNCNEQHITCEKTYSCSKCGDTFSNLGNFKQHQQIHIKETR